MSKNNSMRWNYWQICRTLISIAGISIVVFYLFLGSFPKPGIFFAFLAVSAVFELVTLEQKGKKVKTSFFIYLVSFLLVGKSQTLFLGFTAGTLAAVILQEEKTLPGYFFEGAKNSFGIFFGAYLVELGAKAGLSSALLFTAAFVFIDLVFIILKEFLVEGYLPDKEELIYIILNHVFSFGLGILVFQAISENFGQTLFLGALLSGIFLLVMKINQKLLSQKYDYLTLWNISRTFHHLESPEEMLKTLLQELKNSFSYHTGVIYTYSESLLKFVPRYLNTDYENLPGPDFHNSLLAEVLSKQGPSLIKSQQFGWIAAVPLVNRRDVFGYLVLTSRKGQIFTNQQLKRLYDISGQVALAAYNGYLYLKLKELAQKDELTGLYNRRYFMERLAEEYLRSKRHNFSFTVILLDIDYFKKINDTYGHDCGDLVLSDFGRFLNDTIRRTDLTARYGGEEFVVLLPQTGKKEAYLLAERLREKVKNRVIIFEGQKVKYTVSMGLATYPIDAEEAKELLSLADKALYQAKNRGRDKVVMVNNF